MNLQGMDWRARADLQIRTMAEFLKADVEEAIVEEQQELDRAVARGDEHGRKLWGDRLAKHRETLAKCEADL